MAAGANGGCGGRRVPRAARSCRLKSPLVRADLNRLASDLGGARAVATLDAGALDSAVQGAWGACAPATWNRHVATARSFVAFCRRRGWLAADVAVAVDRRREPADRTRAIPYPQLERLWRSSDVAIREKALWRLL